MDDCIVTADTPLSAASRTNQDKPVATILLVEDNEADIELTRILLHERWHLKCTLIVARDGEEALEKLRHHDIDLLLLDINLPGMDGIELLRLRMREDNALQRIPVIVYTSMGDDHDIGLTELLGADDYVLKPIAFERLKAIVDQAATLELSPEGEGYALRKAG